MQKQMFLGLKRIVWIIILLSIWREHTNAQTTKGYTSTTLIEFDSAVVKSSIEQYEKYIRAYLNKPIYYAGSSHPATKAFALRNKDLEEKLTRGIMLRYTPENIRSKSAEFKEVIETVKWLGKTTTDFDENLLPIAVKIYEIQDSYENTEAQIYFYEHFKKDCPINLPILKAILNHPIRLSTDEGKYNELFIAKLARLLGNHYSHSSIRTSFKCLSTAAYIYFKYGETADFAEVQIEIGNLFSERPAGFYRDKAHSFYASAAFNYLCLNDSTKGFECNLLASLLLIKNEYSSYEKSYDPIEMRHFLLGDSAQLNLNRYFSISELTKNYQSENLFNDYSVLKSCWEEIKHSAKNNSEINPLLWHVLGEYFMSKKGPADYEAAEIAFSIGLLQINKVPHVLSMATINELHSLSQLYIKQRRIPDAMKMIEYGFKFAQSLDDNYWIGKMYNLKAEICKQRGEYSESIAFSHMAIKQSLADCIWENEKLGLLRESFFLLSESYKELNHDSSQSYYQKLRLLESSLVGEMAELHAQEKILSSNINELIVNDRERSIQTLDSAMRIKESRLGFLERDVLALEQLVRLYKSSISDKDSELKVKDSLIAGKNDSLTQIENRILWADKKLREKDTDLLAKDRTLKIKDKKIKNRELYGGLAIALILTALIAFTRLYNLRIKERDKQLHYTRIQLTDLARAKIHNIRSNYNRIRVLATEDSQLLAIYIEKSAGHLKALLHSWVKKDWTLADEFKLLKSFYRAENVLKPNVHIEYETGELPLEQITFIPEVLTTLFFNSVLHAFENKTDNCRFFISIETEADNLKIQVSDNGEGSPIENYRSNDPNDGLNILNDRIKNAFELNGNFYRPKNELHIVADKHSGTTITFRYPYAEIINPSS